MTFCLPFRFLQSFACAQSWSKWFSLLVLLYFDTWHYVWSVNTFFFCKCEFANKCAQANMNHTEKLNPGFTFTLSLCQSTTTQPFAFLVVHHTILQIPFTFLWLYLFGYTLITIQDGLDLGVWSLTFSSFFSRVDWKNWSTFAETLRII